MNILGAIGESLARQDDARDAWHHLPRALMTSAAINPAADDRH